MSSFYTARPSPLESPMLRLRDNVPQLNSIDVTTASAISSVSAALSGLRPNDIALIDEIIERSPRSATTFLTVFKAYNEVLHERGLDASNDVVYYKMLLKVGVVRGHDWGTKWDTVKAQQGYGRQHVADESSSRVANKPFRTAVSKFRDRFQPRLDNSDSRSNGLMGRLRQRAGLGRPIASSSGLSILEKDALTVHSHEDDASQTSTADSEDAVEDQLESVGTETETETTEQPEDDGSTVSGFPGVDSPTTQLRDVRLPNMKVDGPRKSYLPSIDDFLPVRMKRSNLSNLEIPGGSAFSGDSLTRTSTPPLQKPVPSTAVSGATRRSDVSFLHKNDRRRNVPKDPVDNLAEKATDEEIWANAQMARDEKQADEVREGFLLGRCWHVWKSNLHWMKTMNERVDEEYGKSLLENSLAKWRVRLGARQNWYDQIQQRHNARILWRMMDRWTKRLKERRTIKWRDDMRRRMAEIKRGRDMGILHDAWLASIVFKPNKWRRAHSFESQLEKVRTRFESRRLSNALSKWKTALVHLEHQEQEAENFFYYTDVCHVRDLWGFWKMKTELNGRERALVSHVDARLLKSMLHRWKQALALTSVANRFHDMSIQKEFWRRWKTKLFRQRELELKADKHRLRQDDITLMALFRVWKAKERGRLADNGFKRRLVTAVWVVWKSRLAVISESNKRAVMFCDRPSAFLAQAAFQRWHNKFDTQRNLLLQTKRYSEDILVHRALRVWRWELRQKLKMSKDAKAARKYLLLKNSWIKWKMRGKEKEREKKAQVVQLLLVKKYFERWHIKAVRERSHRLLLSQFLKYRSAILLSHTLTAWTERIIFMRDRSWEVARRRDELILSSSYERWRKNFKRHSDDLRLMQSYQYVKREEILRRMFTKWFALAKMSRHRRVVLQEREEEFQLNILEKAWELWRERFKAEKLRPSELKFALELQNRRLYEAYLIWHSKTKSIPALQFASSRLKTKFWRKWCSGMPKALQAREARRFDSKKLLSRALDKWAQAYRTKIALKAIARARYLRLPSGAPLQSLPMSSALRGGLRSSPSITSARTTTLAPSLIPDDIHSEKATSVIDDDAATSNAGSTNIGRRRPLALRMTRLTTTRPTLSNIASDIPRNGRTDLWKELRRARRPLTSEKD